MSEDKVEEIKDNSAETTENVESNAENTSEMKKDTENCAEGIDEAPVQEDQVAILNDKYVRLNAEFDNFRKRNARERVELIQTASLEVIKDLLDVLDDCNRTEKLLEQDDVEVKALKEGVQLVFNKLRKTLENKGLQSFDSKEKEFDVELHEAITEIPAPNKKLKGKVVDEIQKGYNLNGKLIRHAKVVVGK
jgi:molecular chaperone GrpE